MKSKQIGREKSGNDAFEKLLEQSLEKEQELEPGLSLSATVTNIHDKDFVFVNTIQGAGVIQRDELTDREGQVLVNTGEKLHVFFMNRSNGELVFTMHPRGRNAKNIARTALEEKIPLFCKVLRKVKGGYEIEVGDFTAFCPGSLLDDAEPGDIRGFLVIEHNGRRMIVSNKAYQEIEKEKQRRAMEEELEEGAILSGTVLSLHDFGAFIDIGGVEGLIPLSELSHKRLRHPSEVLKSGQEVRVKVLNLDWKENRITLSMKALQENPWQGKLPFNTGDILEGTVEGMKHFGIFVRLPDHFTGLVPMVESDIPRGQPADQVYRRGEQVNVMVQNIDRENEKISLSIRAVKDAEMRKEYEQYMASEHEQGEEVSSFGKALLASLNKD